MNSSWINEVGITTGIAIIAFGWLWLWLCFKGMVNFPLWMVNLFPGYNIKRAWRQAERKLRIAERKAREGERRWMWRQLMHRVAMLGDAKGEIIQTAKQLTQIFNGKKIQATGCTVIVGGRVYTDPNAVDMPQHHPAHAEVSAESIRRIEQGLG